jgi:hypothetical protein
VDVFLIESIIVETDSVFLNGAPAPSTLLGAFGLSQGAQTTTRLFLFYPQNGGRNPIATYEVDGSGAITFFTYRPIEVSKVLSRQVYAVKALEQRLYPNPVAQNSWVNIELDEDFAGELSLTCSDLSSRVVSREFLNINAGDRLVSKIKAHWKPGVYLISMNDSSGKLLGQTKLIVK